MSYVQLARDRGVISLAWRPEWKAAVVVVGVWAILLSGQGIHGGHVQTPAVGTGVHAHDHQHHELESQAPTMPAGEQAPLDALLVGWMLMSVAMMAPLALPAVGFVARNSIRRRRNRAMAVYFSAFMAVWMGFGLVALPIVSLVERHSADESHVLLAGLLAIAAAWQLSRWKRRALNTCGRTMPLPPEGRRADAACMRFALLDGWRCVRSCWSLMLVMAVVGHAHLVWMAALTALVLVEEWTLVGRRLQPLTAATLTLAAGVVLLGA